MTTQKKKILYVDMDGVLCDYDTAIDAELKSNPGIKYPQSQYGFFAKLKPMPHAIEVMEKLKEKFDVYILTAPSLENPMCYTEKRVWVEEHLGWDMVKKLIISPNKGLLKGDYLLDDYTEGRGQEYFEGEVILFGKGGIEDWKGVEKLLL